MKKNKQTKLRDEIEEIVKYLSAFILNLPAKDRKWLEDKEINKLESLCKRYARERLEEVMKEIENEIDYLKGGEKSVYPKNTELAGIVNGLESAISKLNKLIKELK